jgi:ABC-type glycerol-3-phosphate transport system permease component
MVIIDLPVQVALIPVARLLGGINLYGSIPGVVLFHVAFGLPISLPAVASLAIFQFLWVWNDLLVALVFADESSARSRWRCAASGGSSAATSTCSPAVASSTSTFRTRPVTPTRLTRRVSHAPPTCMAWWNTGCRCDLCSGSSG